MSILDYFNGDITGQCYVVSEAYYHMNGGKAAGFVPMVIHHEGGTHWYLRQNGRYIDLTAAQFSTTVPYELGRGCGFLTKQPSKRAQALIDYLHEEEAMPSAVSSVG
jgi:hypothetical protein